MKDRFWGLYRLVAWSVLISAMAVPNAFATSREMTLLASYAGDWRGEAVLARGDSSEVFTCRMNITDARGAKIYYVGRCSLARLNLSVSGAIAFNEDARRYEAVMSSNTAFSGEAVGRIAGDRIGFDFKKRKTDEKDDEISIEAEIVLERDTVTVDFEITFSDSGATMTTSVPFSRQ